MEGLTRLSRARSRLMPEKCTVHLISILSMVTCLATAITYLSLLSSPDSWDSLADLVLHWMVDNNLDVTATRKVVSVLRVISSYSDLVTAAFILLSFLHFSASALLYTAASPGRLHSLFLPWLLSHMLIILTMTTVFICWTFITFFIDLLVSIVFPVLSGLVLGLSILVWRLIFTIYRGRREGEVEGSRDKTKLVS